MAKNYQSMENERNTAISEKQKAVSERDTAFKERDEAQEYSSKVEHNATIKLNLLKSALNIPKNIDTYDKLRKYLNSGNANNHNKRI